MLLHRDDDCLPQVKPEQHSKEETHVVDLSVSKQVLLMTYKVKITAAEGASTIARAVVDPGPQLRSFTRDQHSILVYHVEIRMQ